MMGRRIGLWRWHGGEIEGIVGLVNLIAVLETGADLRGKAWPEIVYGSAVDFYSASMLAFAVSAALFERSRSGVGRYVGLSRNSACRESALCLMLLPL